MKIKYVVSIIILMLFIYSFRLVGQYVCYDRDRYTNVRKGPGTQFEIIDKVLKYELFYSSDWLCVDGSALDTTLAWMPFARTIYDEPERFIFRKNIRSLDDMPCLTSNRINYDYINDSLSINGIQLSCSNDTIGIYLILKDFDKDNHVIKDTIYNDGTKIIQSIDGEWPKGIRFVMNKNEKIKGKEITRLYIDEKNKRIDLPIDVIRDYFNPWAMNVWLGYEGELYIFISVGDASEAYGIYLSIVNEEIKYILEWSAC